MSWNRSQTALCGGGGRSDDGRTESDPERCTRVKHALFISHVSWSMKNMELQLRALGIRSCRVFARHGEIDRQVGILLGLLPGLT